MTETHFIPVHQLKTWVEYFEPIWDDEKKFEIRRNDRNFKVGDILYLMELDIDTHEYTGRMIQAEISYILELFHGLTDGFVAISLKHIVKKDSGIRTTE